MSLYFFLLPFQYAFLILFKIQPTTQFELNAPIGATMQIKKLKEGQVPKQEYSLHGIKTLF